MVKCIENKYRCTNWKVGSTYKNMSVNGVNKVCTEWGLYLALPQNLKIEDNKFEFGMCLFECL